MTSVVCYHHGHLWGRDGRCVECDEVEYGVHTIHCLWVKNELQRAAITVDDVAAALAKKDDGA